MLFIFCIILLCAKLADSYESNIPRCKSCNWFLEGKNIDLGLCKMFPEKINEKTIYNYAAHCRNNENLCGKNGIFYEYNEDENYVRSFNREEYKYYSYYMKNIAKKNKKIK